MQPGSWNSLSLYKDSSMVLLVQLPTESQRRTNPLVLATGPPFTSQNIHHPSRYIIGPTVPLPERSVLVALEPATSPPFPSPSCRICCCVWCLQTGTRCRTVNEHICDDWCESVEALFLLNCPGRRVKE